MLWPAAVWALADSFLRLGVAAVTYGTQFSYGKTYGDCRAWPQTFGQSVADPGPSPESTSCRLCSRLNSLCVSLVGCLAYARCTLHFFFFFFFRMNKRVMVSSLLFMEAHSVSTSRPVHWPVGDLEIGLWWFLSSMSRFLTVHSKALPAPTSESRDHERKGS